MLCYVCKIVYRDRHFINWRSSCEVRVCQVKASTAVSRVQDIQTFTGWRSVLHSIQLFDIFKLNVWHFCNLEKYYQHHLKDIGLMSAVPCCFFRYSVTHCLCICHTCDVCRLNSRHTFSPPDNLTSIPTECPQWDALNMSWVWKISDFVHCLVIFWKQYKTRT